MTAESDNSINSVRRYYLMQRQRARREQSPTEPAWQAKQEAEPGTPLPAQFPLRTKLAPGGYTTYADLNGVSDTELREQLGFTPREAEVVLSELEEFGNPDA